MSILLSADSEVRHPASSLLHLIINRSTIKVNEYSEIF